MGIRVALAGGLGGATGWVGAGPSATCRQPPSCQRRAAHHRGASPADHRVDRASPFCGSTVGDAHPDGRGADALRARCGSDLHAGVEHEALHDGGGPRHSRPRGPGPDFCLGDTTPDAEWAAGGGLGLPGAGRSQPLSALPGRQLASLQRAACRLPGSSDRGLGRSTCGPRSPHDPR